jgi:putative transposase
MKPYDRTSHTGYHHRYHLVGITQYRYRVLTTAMKKRVRDLMAQVAEELRVSLETGVVSSDHVHVVVSLPPHGAVAHFVKLAKGRSWRKMQEAFPELRKTYWGRSFGGHAGISVRPVAMSPMTSLTKISTGIAMLTNRKTPAGAGSNKL